MKVAAYMHSGWLQLATSLRTSSAVIRPSWSRSRGSFGPDARVFRPCSKMFRSSRLTAPSLFRSPAAALTLV